MKITRIVGLGCLFYLVWRPVSNGIILYPVLAVLALVSLVNAQRPQVWFLKAATLMALAIVLMLQVGSFNDTPGLLQQATLWIGAPIIWGLWANSMKVADIRPIITTIVVATIALSLVILLYVATSKTLIPSIVPVWLLEGQGARFTDNAIGTEIGFYGLSSLSAAAPLATVAALAGPQRMLPSRWLTVPAAVLAATAAWTGGRQAILVVTVLAPIMYLVIRRAAFPPVRRSRRKRANLSLVIVCCAPILFVLLVFNAEPIATPLVAAVRDVFSVYFGLGSGSGGSVFDNAARIAQTRELLGGWAEAPLLGAGMGAVLATGFSRSELRPWSFELQYLQLLFQGGLVAVSLVLASVWRAAHGVFSSAKNILEIEALTVAGVAAGSMLLANASNPYLQAPGHWWPLALLVGVAIALGRQSRQTSAPLRSAAISNEKRTT